MWPGYDCSVKALNDGIFMNIDTATKFLNKTSVLEIINGMERDKYSKSEITDTLIPKAQHEKRLVVITMYNSISYQIDGIAWD